MDKDLLLDDILKEKASSEKLPIPDALDLIIKNTIANLPDDRKNKGTILKKLAIAASLAVIIICSISIAFPVAARNLPVVGSVFQFLSENNIIDKDYITYKESLNVSKSSNGVEITINDIAYDGVQLALGYTVKSDKDLKTDPFIFKSNIMINGKTVNTGSGASGLFKDSKSYIGVEYINLGNSSSINASSVNIKIPNEFLINLDIRELVGEIKGNWDFKFKVSKEKINLKSKEIKTDIDLSALRPGLKVNGIILTPINTVIKTSENFNGGFYGDKGGYLIYDDKGRKLNYKSGSGEGSQKSKIYSNQLIYSNALEDTQTINIIPYTTIQQFMQKKNNEKGTVPMDMKEVPISINNNTILDEGKLGGYIITKIDFQKDKTLIYYECSDLMALLSNSKLWIVDNDNKEYAFYDGIVREDQPGSNKYIAELQNLDKNKSYKLKAIDYEKRYNIRDDLKFTIKIR
ncbi:DUF4179 domain-containing protein [Candidatus Clostridium radicumherbarum]|uniref:DUF4179 domain-containing protein n=1 Tax=Candidatus Clostridium radicumherbarum TaxID=3381662 RepID=A0ABW8TVY4_9CLOT